MFQVCDNGKPADDTTACPQLRGYGWTNSVFETFLEAAVYANKWLGEFGPLQLKLGVAVDYSGYGDTILIKEIP